MSDETCQRCGEPAEHILDFGKFELLSCHKCYEEVQAGLAEKRAEFQALLDAGVGRAEANAIMIRGFDVGKQ